MMHFTTDKDDLYTTVFAELKHMGIKIPKVKKFKSNIIKQEKIVQPSKNRIFGVSLADQEWIADCDYVLPKFIVSSITYLRQHSSKVGLFRKAGSNVRQRELRLKLEKGEDIFGSEPNDVATLLKQWLRELPEPLIPQYMHDLFFKCQQLENNENKITAILLTCLLLPPNHLQSLKYLMCFLADFSANSSENMMDSYNLALCMAPNIFVLNDSADKTSANLVHIHVSIIQLMIENAMKIGSVPEFVTFQHLSQEEKTSGDLDSSGDFLDVVTSKRKKQKNGHVQDLLSGIKKLVSQNSSNGTNPKTPEKYWNSHVTAPRSASKREADPDVESVLPTKKQPKLSIEQENMLQNVTPKDKGIMNFGTVGRSGGHIRKKSFGLLRRKERKRQKSCHGNPLTTVTFNIIPPKNQTEETGNFDNPVKDIEVNVVPVPDNTSSKLSKSESIKKSASESYLTPKYGKHHRLSLSSTSSKNDEIKLEIPSYFLRHHETDKETKLSVQQLETACQEIKNINYNCETVASPNVEIQNIEIVVKPASEERKSFGKQLNSNEVSKPLSEVDTPCRPNIQEFKKGGACQRVSRKGSDAQKMSSYGISGLGKRASSSELRSKRRNKSPHRSSKNSKTDLRSVSDSQIKQGSHRSVGKSPNFDKSSHRNGLSRNEAFIIKPKKQRKNSLVEKAANETKRTSKKASTRSVNSLQKSKSLNSELGDQNKVVKSGTKRASRNGSLMRGRPNTVRTGLRCELRGNESILESESPGKRKSLKDNKNGIVEANVSCASVEIRVNQRDNKSESLENRRSPKVNRNKIIVEENESGAPEKRRSVKMNRKNEVMETLDCCNTVKINKESKRGGELEMRKTKLNKKKSVVNECCIPIEIDAENRNLDPKDTSLITRLESFHLSSPVNSSETLIDFINSMFSLEDKSTSEGKIETQNLSVHQNRVSTRLSIDKHRRSSLQLTRDKSPAGSKIPRLRSSLEDKKTNSFSEMTPEPQRKVSKSRVSDSSSTSSKIPTKIPNTSFDISSLQISLNDSCFKTPDNNFQASSSINWVSGNKYLGINSPQEEGYNKRESIALILRNNPGHVQAKVSMYDTRVRESVVCTRSVPTFSTPFEHFDNKRELRSAQKGHKKLHDTRSYDSAENISRRKGKMRSPYPLPPKFNITDTSTPSAPISKSLHNEIVDNCNKKRNSVKESSFKDENCFLKQSLGNDIHTLKESTNHSLILNESENSANLSIKDEKNISKRSMENVSHPLKEVTNISFETKSPLIKDGYHLHDNVFSSGKKQKKLKRSSFTAKSPQKRSKRVSRSESSPGRPRPHDKAYSRIKNSSRSASIILERKTLK